LSLPSQLSPWMIRALSSHTNSGSWCTVVRRSAPPPSPCHVGGPHHPRPSRSRLRGLVCCSLGPGACGRLMLPPPPPTTTTHPPAAVVALSPFVAHSLLDHALIEGRVLPSTTLAAFCPSSLPQPSSPRLPAPLASPCRSSCSKFWLLLPLAVAISASYVDF